MSDSIKIGKRYVISNASNGFEEKHIGKVCIVTYIEGDYCKVKWTNGIGYHSHTSKRIGWVHVNSFQEETPHIFNIGDTITSYDSSDPLIILGFDKQQLSCVVSGKRFGHDGTDSNYHYDKAGNRITIPPSTKSDRWYCTLASCQLKSPASPTTSSIEEWSVGTYVVATAEGSARGKSQDKYEIGYIGCISHQFRDETFGMTEFSTNILDKKNFKWFATKGEAESFAKTLPPKFEVGKWYQRTDGQPNPEWVTWVKCYSSSPFQDSENITYGGRHSCGVERRSEHNWELLTDLSIIQRYLPDGHPDKINEMKVGNYYTVKDTAYSKFLMIGRCITVNEGSSGTDIRGIAEFIATFDKSYGKEKAWCYQTEKTRTFRLSTQDEIDWLNRCIAAGMYLDKDDLRFSTPSPSTSSPYTGYVKYTGDKKAYYRLPNTVYKVVSKSGENVSNVICNLQCAEYAPGSELTIYGEGNWVNATEAEYLAQVKTTPLKISDFKIGDWVYAEKSDDDYRDEEYIPIFQIKGFNEDEGNYLRPVAGLSTGVHFRHCRKALPHEIPPNQSTTEEYQIGDWVVSLKDVDTYRKKGDVFQIVKFGSTRDMIYYVEGTWGYDSTFRRALPHEIPNISATPIKEMSDDDLLAEANRRYPIGTKVICNLGSFHNSKFERVGKLYMDDGYISANGEPFVYFNGEWAEIVEDPKTPSMEEIQAECKRRFPIGCTFKNTRGIEYTLKKDLDTYSIMSGNIWAHRGAGCLYCPSEGGYAQLVSDHQPIESKQPMKEIQEECKRRFPIGCTFKDNASGEIYTLNQKSDTYEIIGESGIDAGIAQGWLYYEGKYAELVDKPKSKIQLAAERALQHFKDAGFYVGCEYKSTSGSIQVSTRELQICAEDKEDCYIDCGPGFIWEYKDHKHDIDVYGEIIPTPKPESPKFRNGDRVKCIKQYSRIKPGMTGTISCDGGLSDPGVTWDDLHDGHDCCGSSPFGKGYYINTERIVLDSTLFFTSNPCAEISYEPYYDTDTYPVPSEDGGFGKYQVLATQEPIIIPSTKSKRRIQVL